MCWGVPAVVVDVDENNLVAKVDFGDSIIREAMIGISSDRISRGDIVVVHAGVIISKLTPEGILEHIEFIKEILGESSKETVNIYQSLLSLARLLKGEDSE
ncbi:MAG: HypC/HybG/HupF family hydrogenase formation chaperone [Ignisphaera sp.]|uniref:Hydrogenase expression/formation protein HypC n=1 Tax=Ignisphaera aggregans TaxID=334771 RepID=A0A7C4JIU7_9CREN